MKVGFGCGWILLLEIFFSIEGLKKLYYYLNIVRIVLLLEIGVDLEYKIIIILIVIFLWGFLGIIYKFFIIYKSKNDNKIWNYNLWWYFIKLNFRVYEGNVCFNSVFFRVCLKDVNEVFCLSLLCKLFYMLVFL